MTPRGTVRDPRVSRRHACATAKSRSAGGRPSFMPARADSRKRGRYHAREVRGEYGDPWNATESDDVRSYRHCDHPRGRQLSNGPTARGEGIAKDERQLR